jgi:prepilin-type N-terminal cleavage/methylation domain-containing protein/prepilin-type processing-associated H-X9-DG protein
MIQKSRCSKSMKRAFTLIELLVVVAIIALLAAILYPVFARARENAKRASCQSNLKQLGLAVTQYSQDYDERMPPIVSRYCLATSSFILGPPSWFSGGTPQCSSGTQHPGWIEAIYPYVKSKSLFTCPSDFQNKLTWASNLTGALQSSYGMNYFLGWTNGGVVNYSGTAPYWGAGSASGTECDQATNNAAQSTCGDFGYPMAKIQRASEIILMSEFGMNSNLISGVGDGRRGDYPYFPFYYGPNPYVNPISGDYCSLGPSSCTMRVASAHLATTNFLFIDGHVKAERVAGNAASFAASGSNEWLPVVGDNNNSALDTHWHPDK